jgi:hypothetical protein
VERVLCCGASRQTFVGYMQLSVDLNAQTSVNTRENILQTFVDYMQMSVETWTCDTIYRYHWLKFLQTSVPTIMTGLSRRL